MSELAGPFRLISQAFQPTGERLLRRKGNSNGKEECTRRPSCPQGVITLISNMCQEPDSSRQARGELGLCSCGTKAEATDSHSSISALIREMMGKHTDAGGGKIIKFAECLENVHLLWGSQDTICVFKCCCVGCEIWACSDQIQLSPPLLPLAQPLVSPPQTLLDSITARVSTATSGEDADNSFCSVSS